MTEELEYDVVGVAEMHPNVYGGEECDEIIPMWKSYFEGDKEGDHSKDDLVFDPSLYPPGTKIIIKEPVCPECQDIKEFCSDDCKFDWKEWTLNKYS